MFTRRDLARLAAGALLSGSVGSHALSRQVHSRVDDNGWQVSPTFFFQKSVRKNGYGVPEETFPAQRLKDLIWSRGAAAYYEIVDLFEEYISAPVDPAGALLKIPSYAEQLVKQMSPPPREGSRELAAELLELYWCERLRDLPFESYEQDHVCRIAFEELKALGLDAYQNRPSHQLFGAPWSAQNGYYLSAFLLADVPKWPARQKQKYPSFLVGEDFGVDEGQWQWLQSGEMFMSKPNELKAEVDYLRTGRRLATLVYQDHPTQLFDNVAVQLNQIRFRVLRRRGVWGFHERYTPFVFGGIPDLMCHVSVCCKLALDACWLAKWGRFLYPRPEEVSHWVLLSKDGEPLWMTRQILAGSQLLRATGDLKLLSQAYPDGAPIHPSYPAGHAAIAGAAITVIKAFLRPDAELPSGFVDWEEIGIATPVNETLRVNDELNKLAWNVSFGRSFAGIHFRSDSVSGLLLGEELALQYLSEIKKTFPAPVPFTIRRLSGQDVRI